MVPPEFHFIDSIFIIKPVDFDFKSSFYQNALSVFRYYCYYTKLLSETLILTGAILIIGFITCGKEFGVKTVYTSIMLPIYASKGSRWSLSLYSRILLHHISFSFFIPFSQYFHSLTSCSAGTFFPFIISWPLSCQSVCQNSKYRCISHTMKIPHYELTS